MNVLHVATLNQPIRSTLGYGPIETVVYNIDKGLHKLGHRSIVACAGDSRVIGEQYTTIDTSRKRNTSLCFASDLEPLRLCLDCAAIRR